MVLECRRAEGQYDRLPTLPAELIRLRPAVIVTSGRGPGFSRTRRRRSLASWRSRLLRADQVLE